MAGQNAKGIKRLVNATKYSWQGFKAAYKHEEAFRQEVWLAIVALPLGFYLGDSGIERALMSGSIFLILIVELLNSGIEATVDRFGGEKHELSGRAKDIGSAAVLLALLNATVIWSFILLH